VVTDIVDVQSVQMVIAKQIKSKIKSLSNHLGLPKGYFSSNKGCIENCGGEVPCKRMCWQVFDCIKALMSNHGLVSG